MSSSPLLSPSNAAIVLCSDDLIANKELSLSAIRTASASIAQDCELKYMELAARPVSSALEPATSPLGELQFRSLLLVGGTLEFAITQVAIQAILEGFDVFVIADLIRAQSIADTPLVLDRLRFRGVDVLTSKQARLELSYHPVALEHV